jgi:hypothetical protein
VCTALLQNVPQVVRPADTHMMVCSDFTSACLLHCLWRIDVGECRDQEAGGPFCCRSAGLHFAQLQQMSYRPVEDCDLMR